MKKMAFALMTVSLVVSVPSFAQELGQNEAPGAAPVAPVAAKPAKKAEPVALQDVHLTGRISKSEKTDKQGKTKAVYMLIDAEGKETKLPIPRAPKVKKGEAAVPAISLDAYVGKTVNVFAKGTEKVDKSGKKSVQVREVLNVTLAGPDAGAGVAPVPAPAQPTL